MKKSRTELVTENVRSCEHYVWHSKSCAKIWKYREHFDGKDYTKWIRDIYKCKKLN